ncbi:MAG: hypothetical protein L6275_04350, partial [Candidatus Portnoybacteria bacterium]|nr:hypothetical protein [Candidatus Portnoybacteria bacterium]
SSINIVQDLSDTLSDTPQRAVNKTKNAFLPIQKSLEKGRFALFIKIGETRIFASLFYNEVKNNTILRPTKVVKSGLGMIEQTTASIFDSIIALGEKTVQISDKIQDILGETYIKVAEFLIPGYSFDETAELLPQRTVITKTEEPIIQEVVKQVQQITPKVVITEVTKEKVIEITETVQSADLIEINQELEAISTRITNLASQISSRIDYTTPSYAPIYVPSSGIQVSGHALLTTLNVSGSGSVGGSLSVGGNAGFGSPNVSTDSFDVYSDATFHESVSFDKGVSAASLGVSGTLSAATTTLSQLSINNAYWFPTTAGSSNQILKTDADGIISWQADGGAAGGAVGWSYDADSTLLTRSTTTDQTLIGGLATTSATAIFEVIGLSELDDVNMAGASSTSLYIDGDLTISGNNDYSDLLYADITDGQAGVWADVWASTTLDTILTNSQTSYGWGDHSIVGYLTDYDFTLGQASDVSTTTLAYGSHLV